MCSMVRDMVGNPPSCKANVVDAFAARTPDVFGRITFSCDDFKCYVDEPFECRFNMTEFSKTPDPTDASYNTTRKNMISYLGELYGWKSEVTITFTPK